MWPVPEGLQLEVQPDSPPDVTWQRQALRMWKLLQGRVQASAECDVCLIFQVLPCSLCIITSRRNTREYIQHLKIFCLGLMLWAAMLNWCHSPKFLSQNSRLRGCFLCFFLVGGWKVLVTTFNQMHHNSWVFFCNILFFFDPFCFFFSFPAQLFQLLGLGLNLSSVASCRLEKVHRCWLKLFPHGDATTIMLRSVDDNFSRVSFHKKILCR